VKKIQHLQQLEKFIAGFAEKYKGKPLFKDAVDRVILKYPPPFLASFPQ